MLPAFGADREISNLSARCTSLAPINLGRLNRNWSVQTTKPQARCRRMLSACGTWWHAMRIAWPQQSTTDVKATATPTPLHRNCSREPVVESSLIADSRTAPSPGDIQHDRCFLRWVQPASNHCEWLVSQRLDLVC